MNTNPKRRAAERRLALALLPTLALMPGNTVAQHPSHAAWSALLDRHVDANGRVDYDRLGREREPLDRYLEDLERVSPDSQPAAFRTAEDRLAYWLNAYNALVVAGVLDRAPGTRSVWGDGLSGIGFFTARRWTLGGERMSLQHLEDEIVRKRFGDARVHAALNCASLGCPKLRRLAFEGATVETDLDRAMRDFVADGRNCRIDPATRTVWLSKIFDWYEEDFVAFERRRRTLAPTVVDFINRYRASGQRIPPGFRARYFDYDKTLNRQPADAASPP